MSVPTIEELEAQIQGKQKLPTEEELELRFFSGAPAETPIADPNDIDLKQVLDRADKLKLNLEDTETYDENLTNIEKKKPIGFLEGLTEDALFKIPVTGPFLEGLELVKIKLAAIRLNDPDFDWENEAGQEKRRLDWEYGKPRLVPTMSRKEYLDRRKAITAESARQDDIDGVTGYITAMAKREERGYNFWGRVGQGLSVLPAWMFEFALTAGLYKTSSTAVKNLLQKHAKSKLLAKTGGWIAGSAVRTTVGMPQRVFANSMQRSLNKDEGWATSIAFGWGETFIEAASEQAGETITGGLSYVAGGAINKLPFGSKFLSKLQSAWVKLAPDNTAAQFAKRMASKAGYSNLIGEMGEERLATILHGLVGTETFGQPEGANSLDRILAGLQEDFKVANILSEAVVLSVPGAIKFSIGQLGKEVNDFKLAMAIEEKIGVSKNAAEKAVRIKNSKGVEEADKYISAVKTVGEKAAEKVIAEAEKPIEAIEKPPSKPVAERKPSEAVEAPTAKGIIAQEGEPTEKGRPTIIVPDKGLLVYEETDEGLTLQNIDVVEAERRKGIGTAMVSKAEEITGKKFTDYSKVASLEGKAFVEKVIEKPTLQQRVDKAFKENDLEELVRLRNEAKGEFGNKLTMLISEVEYRNLDKLTMGKLKQKARFNNIPTNISKEEMIRRIKEVRKISEPTEPQQEAQELEESIPEVKVDVKPGPPKTLKSIREEGQRPADVTIVMPTEKPTRVIEPAKGKKKVAVSLEDKKELFKYTDFGTGIGIKGKKLYHIATQKELATFDNAKAARLAATTLGVESGINFKEKDFNKIQDQFNEWRDEKGLRGDALKDFLTGKGKELEIEDYAKIFDHKALRAISMDPKKAVETIAARLNALALEVPEFTLNPTFTFDKESGMLVFSNGYKFRYYPEVLGISREGLKDGQTIRFEWESIRNALGLKAIGKKTLKEGLETSEMFLGKKKILGRTTKKSIPLSLPKRKTMPIYTQRKMTAAENTYERALTEIEIGKESVSKEGFRSRFVNEDMIRKTAELGQKAGRKAWTVERDILAIQERGTADTKVPLQTAIKTIRDVFSKPKKPKAISAGKVGFPGKIAGGEMPKALELAAREPVTAKEIITHLSKALKVPYAGMATHRPRAAAGWYEVKERGIRQIDVRDLETATHEVGHHIDHFYKIRQAGVSRAGQKIYKMPEGTVKGTAAELVRLGKMLYGTRKPPGGYKSEGIAEYVRGYLTGHLNVEKEAPKFHKWFNEDYLPNNPDVAQALEKSRDLLTSYRLQGAEARIESQINTKEIKGSISDRANATNLWFQQMFVDEFAPLRKGIEEAGIKKGELKPAEDPYELAVYFTQKEGARARQMVLFGTIDLWGNKTGKGLKEVMKPIADQNAVRPFTHFVVAARSLNLLKRGINPGISKEDAQYVYDLYKDNEGWQETAKEITDWNHRVLNYLVEAGALPKGTADKMIEANPIYVPFLRAFAKGEKRFGGGGAGGGLITTKKGVFAIKGSGREIIDPFESMITQTHRMIAIAHKSVIARSLANLEARHRGLADLIWKVPAPKEATTFRAEQAIKQLQKMGVEVTGEGLPEPGEMMEGKPAVYDALLTVYGNSPIYLGKENIIAIVQNGKKSWYEVSPDMYKLLQGLDKFYMPRFWNATVGRAGRAMRLGATGLNASFGLVRNPLRDMQDTIFKGTHARGPGATVKGVAKDLSRLGIAKSMGIEPSKAAEAFVAQGGQISGFVGQDRKSLQHLKGELLASSIGKYTIHTLKHPIDAMREVFGVAETGPRIQEYEKALEFGEKKYGKGSPDAKVYAFNKAQDQTINYSRHGIIGKWLNQMIPFWNANAQDVSKVSRTFRKRGKEATAYAVAFLTLPALGLWWYNKDEEWYKELPAFEKANYLHVKIPGKDSIVRIPVPFLVGHIFQGLPVATVDALYKADKTKVTEFFKEVLEADVYSLTEWPAIVSPVIDVLQNKDWAGRPIVPRRVEEKLPSDQYKEYTTEFAKSIGKVLNASPAVIEHLMNSYSGGLYRRAATTAELAAGRREREFAAVDIPIIGKLFVRDPYAPKASIEKFYKRKELLEAKFQSDKITGKEIGERALYNSIGNVLSELWKLLKDEKTIEGRKELYRKIDRLIVSIEKR